MVAGALGIRLFAAQQSAALFGGAPADIDRLLQLPPTVQKHVADGDLSAGHARALLGSPDRSFQEELALLAV